MKLSDLRANDLVIKRLLQKIREVGIQNPEYTAIKTILENGADNRYASTEATENDIQAAQLNQDKPIKLSSKDIEYSKKELKYVRSCKPKTTE